MLLPEAEATEGLLAPEMVVSGPAHGATQASIRARQEEADREMARKLQRELNSPVEAFQIPALAASMLGSKGKAKGESGIVRTGDHPCTCGRRHPTWEDLAIRGLKAKKVAQLRLSTARRQQLMGAQRKVGTETGTARSLHSTGSVTDRSAGAAADARPSGREGAGAATDAAEPPESPELILLDD